MRRFIVKDGEGEVVGEGVMFTDDQVAVAWKAMISAVTVYQNIEVLHLIHGKEGLRSVFLDDPQ